MSPPRLYFRQLMAAQLKAAMLCILVAGAFDITAQPDPSACRHFTIADGLSDNTVTAMLQDDMGYIWIGTHYGLNRYDGRTFAKYLHKSGDSTSIPDNYIFRLKNLGGDRLAIVTRGGIQVLHTRSAKSINYIIPDTTAYSITSNLFWDIIEIQGQGYLASSETGFFLFAYDGSLLWRFEHEHAHDTRRFFRYGREMYDLPDGKILCLYFGRGNAKIFDPATWQMEEADTAAPELNGLKDFLGHGGGSVASLPGYRFLMTGWFLEGIRAYDLVAQTSAVSATHMNASREFGWPGFVTAIHDSLLVQAAGNGGFFLLHLHPETLQVITDTTRYFSGHQCMALIRDKDSRWWIGTEYGLYMQSFVRPSVTKHFVRRHIADHAETKAINAIHAADGKVYFSAGDKDGVTVLDAATFAFEKQIRLDHPVAEWNDIMTIGSLNPDTLWFGSRMGLIWYARKTGARGIVTVSPGFKGTTTYSSFFKDSRSNIWMGVTGEMNGVLLYEQASKKFTHFSLKDTVHYFPMPWSGEFTEDHRGHIWARFKGLARFTYDSMRFDTLMNPLVGYRKFQYLVMALSADDRGNLWCSTDGNGLIRYEIDKDVYTTYTAPVYLSSDLVLSLLYTRDDKLLIGTRAHLNIMDPGTKETRVLDQKDGLPLAPISSHFAYDQLHDVYIAAYDDEIAVIPADIPTSSFPPPVFLVEYMIAAPDTVIHYPDAPVNLPYTQNSLEVHFTWMDFDGNDHVRTWYRLKNGDAWTDLNGAGTIILGNVSPGLYDLQVRITSQTGHWPEQVRSVAIRIHPPFWKTSWFVGLVALTTAITGYWLYRNHIRKIQTQANMDKLLADYEMKALHSQMNPHFIFNCLNSIKETILLGDRDKAGYYLGGFAQLIRDTLEHSRSDFISLEQSIDYIRRYIEMEKIRFSDFTYSIEIDPALRPREIKVLPMLVQPLIENAIWHGLSQVIGEKKLEIRFGIHNGDRLLCIITDNGPGIRRSMQAKNGLHVSTGIENIRKRIELLNQKNQVNSRLVIRDRSDDGGNETGTIVELDLLLDTE